MPIPFTQFMFPDGRKNYFAIQRPKEIETAALGLIDAGYRFEIETLRTGEINMDISNEDEVIAAEICSSRSEVPLAVDRMVIHATQHLASRIA